MDNVAWAAHHPLTKMRKRNDKKMFERKFGDLVIYRKNGTLSTIEVKVDDYHQFTNRVGFEYWDRWYNKSSHDNEPGWWNPRRNTRYNQLFFVMVNCKAIMITDAKKAKKWTYDNNKLFEVQRTNKSTQDAEGKVSVSWYINRDEFLRCPYAVEVDVDTSKINDFILQDETLGARRARMEAKYR